MYQRIFLPLINNDNDMYISLKAVFVHNVHQNATVFVYLYNMTWNCLAFYHTVSEGTVWYGMIWYDMTTYGMVWYTIWYGKATYGMV